MGQQRGHQAQQQTSKVESQRDGAATERRSEDLVDAVQEWLGTRAASRQWKSQMQQAEESNGAQPTHSLWQSMTGVSPRSQGKPRFRGVSQEWGGTSSGLVVQPKLMVGEPNDKYEQEADRVAQQVVQQMQSPSVAQTGAGVAVQRLTDEDEAELQRKSESLLLGESAGGMAASGELEASIRQARGGGAPLPETVREPMERAFGADFSGVRIHTNAQADQLNRSISAKAFTTGQDVFVRQGAYQPGSREGQELLAHELTHVVQQKNIETEVPESSIQMTSIKTHKTLRQKESDQTVMHRSSLHHKWANYANQWLIEKRNVNGQIHHARRSADSDIAVQCKIFKKNKSEGKSSETLMNLDKIKPDNEGAKKVIAEWNTSDAHYVFDDEKELIQQANAFSISRQMLDNGETPPENANGDNASLAKIGAYVAHQIRPAAEPRKVDYNNVQKWADWYFSKLEYQGNTTGGWHRNEKQWLLNAAGVAEVAEAGKVNRYVEFRFVNDREPEKRNEKKELTKLERCILDIVELRVFPNAHYNGGYVEITNIPQKFKKALLRKVWNSGNGLRDYWTNMKEKPSKAKTRKILDAMKKDGE